MPYALCPTALGPPQTPVAPPPRHLTLSPVGLPTPLEAPWAPKTSDTTPANPATPKKTPAGS